MLLAVAMIADLLAAFHSADAPAHPALQLGLLGIAVLLFLACVAAAYLPEVFKPRQSRMYRDRRGSR